MTVVTVVAAGYMCRILASRCDAIVATATVAENLRVIDREYRSENCCCVTVFANIRCLHMRRVLAGGKRAVVTTHAVVGIGGMIERRRQPASSRMAVIAGIAARYMQRVFADSGNSIMTGSAIAHYLGVINRQYWRKEGCRMAILANISRLNMRGSFANRFSAVVAADAIVRNI